MNPRNRHLRAALAEVRTGPALSAWVRSLKESRLTTLEQRIEADLRMGRHHELVGELRALSPSTPPTRTSAHS